MKRANHLMNSICDLDNLYLAYWKSKKGKTLKKDFLAYSSNLDENLYKLQNELETANVTVGDYSYFTIHDPKERIICAASFAERVLHHALMNVCHSVFEKHFIYHTYATRPNKGTHKAIAYAKKQALKYKFYAKLDVRKYFDSIDHTILIKALTRLFKENELLYIFHQIINSYQTTENKGLPIGNLTSQYFANYYLSVADHFVLEILKLPYVRYMDDMLFFSNDKFDLIEKIKEFELFLYIKLNLDLKIKSINFIKYGFPFLGFRIFPQKIKLGTVAKPRFRKKLFLFYSNLLKLKWNSLEYQKHVLPLLSFVKHADTFGLRSNYIFSKEKGVDCKL